MSFKRKPTDRTFRISGRAQGYADGIRWKMREQRRKRNRDYLAEGSAKVLDPAKVPEAAAYAKAISSAPAPTDADRATTVNLQACDPFARKDVQEP